MINYFEPKLFINMPFMGFSLNHLIEHTFPKRRIMMRKPYDPPLVEQWVSNTFIHAGILYPDQLNPEHVAKAFGIDYSLWPGITCSYRDPSGKGSYIIQNNAISEAKRRQNFFHELAHVLRHAGDQRDMVESFRQMQEWDADLFAMYAAVPFHMIDFNKPYTASSLMEEFTVTEKMSLKRIRDIRAKTYWESRREYEAMVCEPATPAYNISEKSSETQRIVDQLKKQLEQRGDRLEIHDLL